MPIDILNPNVRKSIAKDLGSLLEDPTIIGGIQNRYISSYINPEQGNIIYNAGNNGGTIVRFKFPSSCIDFRNSSLQYLVNIGKTGGTYLRLAQNATCVFQKIRILFGSQEVYMTENFNLLDSYFNLYQDTSWYNGIGKLFRGMGDATFRNSQANSGIPYLVHFGCLVELLDKIMPLNMINQQFIVELTLANPNACVETDGTSPTMSISNVEWHYDYVQLEESFNDLLRARINSPSGFCIPYRKYNNYVDTSITTGVLNAQIQLPYRYLALQGVISLMRNSANLLNSAINDKFYSYLGYTNFVNTVIKVNNVLLPSDRVNNTSEVLELDLQLFAKKYEDDVYISTNWSQYFSIGFPLMQDARDFSFDQLQGITASTSGFSLIHQLQLSANTVNNEMQYFAVTGACVKILPNGGIEFAE